MPTVFWNRGTIVQVNFPGAPRMYRAGVGIKKCSFSHRQGRYLKIGKLLGCHALCSSGASRVYVGHFRTIYAHTVLRCVDEARCATLQGLCTQQLTTVLLTACSLHSTMTSTCCTHCQWHPQVAIQELHDYVSVWRRPTSSCSVSIIGYHWAHRWCMKRRSPPHFIYSNSKSRKSIYNPNVYFEHLFAYHTPVEETKYLRTKSSSAITGDIYHFTWPS